MFSRNFSRDAAIGWVQDIGGHNIYKNYTVQPNGGLVLMDLARLRHSKQYLPALERYDHAVGNLGDQSLYAHMSKEHPSLFHKLPCGWNRQLNTHVPVWQRRFMCPTCDALHFNGLKVKWVADQLHQQGRATCTELDSLAKATTGVSMHVLRHTISDTCCGLHGIFHGSQSRQPFRAKSPRQAINATRSTSRLSLREAK